MPDKPKQQAIATYLEAWNTGNLDALDEVFVPDVIFHAPPYPDMDSGWGEAVHRRDAGGLPGHQSVG